MIVLGIETTCDDTAIAIVRDGREIISHVKISQEEVHQKFGGVMPEAASREHIKHAIPLVNQAVLQAGVSLSAIDLIAVSYGPGLIGSLLVGIQLAKALAWALDRPLVGVNHVEAHLYAAMMHAKTSYSFPGLGVILSGGHSTILWVDDIGSYRLIGQTADDALGEAFDKVSKMLELGYPGGPIVEERASKGDVHAFSFRSGTVKGYPYSFSFSGLKTAVLYAKNRLLQEGSLSEKQVNDLCASFQRAAFEDVVGKLAKAVVQFTPHSLFLGGGVAQNSALRSLVEQRIDLPIFWPDREFCMDNAVMVAGLGFHQWDHHPVDERWTLDARTRIPFVGEKERR